MGKRKIRVFLGGYCNVTQAQCLNCRAVAKALNKELFDVCVRSVYSGDLDIPKENGLTILPVHYPARIWEWTRLIQGILWSDVIYWTSPEYRKLFLILSKLFRKKSWGTIEGVYSGVAYERAITAFGGEAGTRAFHALTTKTFAITKAMIQKNQDAIKMNEPDGVLYLGTDYHSFAAEKQVTCLTDVLLIGADLYRKGLADYLQLASQFPQLTFHVAGGGVGADDYAEQCKQSHPNVCFHGRVPHDRLPTLFAKVQLHIFPSRAEGFPKVTLETAAAGVPSLVYDDYGADEWITTGKDGFVVKTLEEMQMVVQDLLDHPEKLQPLADNARAMAKRFDWDVVIKDWEREIEALALQ